MLEVTRWGPSGTLPYLSSDVKTRGGELTANGRRLSARGEMRHTSHISGRCQGAA